MTAINNLSSSPAVVSQVAVATDVDGDNDGSASSAPVAPHGRFGPAVVFNLSSAAQQSIADKG